MTNIVGMTRFGAWLGALLLAGLAVFSGAAAAQTAVPQSREQITLSFAPVVKRTASAVVNVYTKTVVRQRSSPLRSGTGNPASARSSVLLPAALRPITHQRSPG